MRINVVMPVYNGERFIAEAVDSLLGQTFQDWELIVVNDGSTDATPEILAAYSDSRINVIHQDNRGIGSARNRALNVASGEFIAFLDADDLYLPSGLADLVRYLDSHSEFHVVYSDGIMCDQDRKPLMRLTEIRPGIYEGNILENVVLSSAVITVPVCTMVRQTAIEAQQLRFDPSLVVASDSDFWIRLARSARFGYLDKITCMYRVHQTNISRTVPSPARRDARFLAKSKVLESGWFEELSLETRTQFLYGLVVRLLEGQATRQSDLMKSASFLSLPAAQQGFLYRQVASSYLLQRQELAFAKRCLEHSSALCPDDVKSQVLLQLLQLGSVPCFLSLWTWQKIHQSATLVRAVGKRKPKPVPAPLRW